MSDGPVVASPPPGASSRRAGRRWVPFWLLQVSELALAVVFVDLSVHVSNSRLLVVGAVVLAVVALTGKGPLGVVKLCPPRVHVVVVTVVALLLAAALLLPALRPDVQGVIVLLFCVVGLLRLAMLTRTAPALPRAGPGRGPGDVIDASASVHDDPGVRAAGGPGTRRAPGAGAVPGTGTATGTAGAPDTAARRAGQAAGLAAALGRQAVGRHRPAAEAKVKRAVRGAGRVVGSWTADGEPPGPGPAPADDGDGHAPAPGPGPGPEPTTS